MMLTAREGNFGERLITETLTLLCVVSSTAQFAIIATLAGGGGGTVGLDLLCLLRPLRAAVLQRLQRAQAYLFNQTHLGGLWLLLLVPGGGSRTRRASKARFRASVCCCT